MKCDLKKELLIGYFYEDLGPDDTKTVQEHLVYCSACKTALEEFSSTTDLLRLWPDEQANLKLTFVEDKRSLWSAIKPGWLTAINWPKLGIGFASAVVAALVILSLLNFQASYTDNGLAVKMSVWPQTQEEQAEPMDPLSLPVTRREFTAWQQQSLQFIHEMIETTQDRQHRQIDMKLANYLRELEIQRRSDLELLEEGLQIFQLSNENRFEQTNQVIQELIRFAHYQGQPSDQELLQGK